MDYSAFSSLISIAAVFGFFSGISFLSILDTLFDFIVKKKSQIEKLKKGD